MLTMPPSKRRSAVIGVVLMIVLATATAWGLHTEDRIPGTASAAPTPAASPTPVAPPPTAFLHVSPTGSDSGDGSAGAPMRTIQAGLDKATPGTQITLAPGVYREQLHTVRDGSPDAPITIKGPEAGTDRAGRYQATVYGTGRILSIDHSYYALDGFTIDGQEQLAGVPFPTDLSTIDAFKNSVQDRVDDSRLIYIGSGEETHDLTGIAIDNMFLSGAGGECVRMRNNAHHNSVTDSVIQYCGMYAKGEDDGDRAVYHNGEGVYIGTSPNSDDQPMHDNDGSSNNVVARNIIRTFGSECLNVKENAHDNVFEDNTCSDNAEQAQFNGSNVEIRGHLNIVRNNTISDSAGYSVKIATDDEDVDKGGNAVQNNHLTGSQVALKLQSHARQGPICGNVTATSTLVEGDLPADITAPC
jgi:Right handed beta helix region/Protein of unknown function (DUF1565)